MAIGKRSIFNTFPDRPFACTNRRRNACKGRTKTVFLLEKGREEGKGKRERDREIERKREGEKEERREISEDVISAK